MYDIIRKEAVSKKSNKNSRLIQKKSKPYTVIHNDNRVWYDNERFNKDNKVFSSKKQIIQYCGSKQLQQNRKAGQRAEEQAGEQLRQMYPTVVPQVTLAVNTPQGPRRVRADFVAEDAKHNHIVIEVKASPTAPLTKNQRAAYPYIFQNGATIMSTKAIALLGTNQLPPGTNGHLMMGGIPRVNKL